MCLSWTAEVFHAQIFPVHLLLNLFYLVVSLTSTEDSGAGFCGICLGCLPEVSVFLKGCFALCLLMWDVFEGLCMLSVVLQSHQNKVPVLLLPCGETSWLLKMQHQPVLVICNKLLFRTSIRWSQIDSPANMDTCQEINGSAGGGWGQLVQSWMWPVC